MNKVLDVFNLKFIADRASISKGYAGHRLFYLLRSEFPGVRILWEVGKGFTGRSIIAVNNR